MTHFNKISGLLLIGLVMICAGWTGTLPEAGAKNEPVFGLEVQAWQAGEELRLDISIDSLSDDIPVPESLKKVQLLSSALPEWTTIFREVPLTDGRATIVTNVRLEGELDVRVHVKNDVTVREIVIRQKTDIQMLSDLRKEMQTSAAYSSAKPYEAHEERYYGDAEQPYYAMHTHEIREFLTFEASVPTPLTLSGPLDLQIAADQRTPYHYITDGTDWEVEEGTGYQRLSVQLPDLNGRLTVLTTEWGTTVRLHSNARSYERTTQVNGETQTDSVTAPFLFNAEQQLNFHLELSAVDGVYGGSFSLDLESQTEHWDEWTHNVETDTNIHYWGSGTYRSGSASGTAFWPE